MIADDARLPISDRGAGSHVGFLLIPDFALMTYASAIEPLRAANLLSGRALYRWSHISIDGRPAPASNGIRIEADCAIGADIRFDMVLVCAGGNPATFRHAPTFAWLRETARRGARIGGISGGPYVLARAGLLHGHPCTIHWEHASAFREEFPDLDVRRTLFEIDRERLTCSGGISALDMMHAVIEAEHGVSLAQKVSDWFLQSHARPGRDPQRMALRERYGVSNPKLLKALEKMESRIDNPVSRAELARFVGVSTRQLERLFLHQLGDTPARAYAKIRLQRANSLLRESSLSILDVAVASGFASGSHFARAYKQHFGRSPSRERTPPPAAKAASGERR